MHRMEITSRSHPMKIFSRPYTLSCTKVIRVVSQPSMRRIAILLLCTAFSMPARAGSEKFQLTLMLSPTVEWMHFSKSPNAALYNSLWGQKLSYNFGFEYKRFIDPSMSISFGAVYMNKG